MSEPDAHATAAPEPIDPAGLRCDFCGDVVLRVRRVALDRDYERLQTRHAIRYACESCSIEKEKSRAGR